MVLGAHFQEDRPQSSILKAGQRRILVPSTEQKRVAFRSPLSLVCANDGDSSSDAYALEVGGNKGWNVYFFMLLCPFVSVNTSSGLIGWIDFWHIPCMP